MKVLVRGIKNEKVEFQCGDAQEVMKEYALRTGVPMYHLRGTQASRPVSMLNPLLTFVISLKVMGGKGGFGSLLRGQGMVARVDNFEACRDLNGRRIRHINDEIRLKEWEEKQQERKKAETVAVPMKRKKPDSTGYKLACKESSQALKKAVLEGMKRTAPAEILKQPEHKEEEGILKKFKITK